MLWLGEALAGLRSWRTLVLVIIAITVAVVCSRDGAEQPASIHLTPGG